MPVNYPPIVFLDTTESTSLFAHELLKSHKVIDRTVVSTFHQTAGRGQRENSWYSGSNHSLTFSIIFIPPLLHVSKHFLLNKVFCLGIADFLYAEGINNVKVKWPNDVLVNDKKIAGILLENAIRGEFFANIIAGVGININAIEPNQSYKFPPLSLAQVTGKEYDLKETLYRCLACLFKRYDQLFSNVEVLAAEYRNCLYHLNESVTFKSAEGEFEGILKNVNDDGLIEIESNGIVAAFTPSQVSIIYK